MRGSSLFRSRGWSCDASPGLFATTELERVEEAQPQPPVSAPECTSSRTAFSALDAVLNCHRQSVAEREAALLDTQLKISNQKDAWMRKGWKGGKGAKGAPPSTPPKGAKGAPPSTPPKGAKGAPPSTPPPFPKGGKVATTPSTPPPLSTPPPRPRLREREVGSEPTPRRKKFSVADVAGLPAPHPTAGVPAAPHPTAGVPAAPHPTADIPAMGGRADMSAAPRLPPSRSTSDISCGSPFEKDGSGTAGYTAFAPHAHPPSIRVDTTSSPSSPVALPSTCEDTPLDLPADVAGVIALAREQTANGVLMSSTFSSPIVALTVTAKEWQSDVSSSSALSTFGRWPLDSELVVHVACPTAAALCSISEIANDQAPDVGKLRDLGWACASSPLSEVRSDVARLFEDPAIAVVLFNAQLVLSSLVSTLSIPSMHKVVDVRTMAWMIQPASTWSRLSDIATDVLQYSSAVPESSRETDIRWRQRLITLAYVVLRRNLGGAGLLACFMKVESRLPIHLARMHVTGFPIDLRELTAGSQQLKEELLALEEEARLVTGLPSFNIQSTEDVRSILFETLQLHNKVPDIQQTRKRGLPSTNEDTLRLLTPYHSLPELILRHRKLARLLSTYIQNLTSQAIPLPDSHLSLLHPTFVQEGTDTGRLSCHSPNLQNQPRGEVEATCVRRAFVPFEGELLLAFDYSQIEVRVLAHMSRDPVLVGALQRGTDLHRVVASRITGKPPNEVTADERRVGKRVVFGTIYGQGVKGLSSTLGVSLDKARELLFAFRRAFPRAHEWTEQVIRECRQAGLVRTFSNRIRHLRQIQTGSPFERAQAERQAVNTIIQGSAADIIKQAMLAADKRAREHGLRLLCQVHDEVIYSCPPTALNEAAHAIRKEMENVVSLSVPLVVNVEYGKNWAALVPWEGGGQQPHGASADLPPVLSSGGKALS